MICIYIDDLFMVIFYFANPKKNQRKKNPPGVLKPSWKIPQ